MVVRATKHAIPSGVGRVVDTNRLPSSAATRSSCACGSASMILASTNSKTRDGASPITSLIASSIAWACSSVRLRVMEATLRATQASTSRSRTRDRVAGRRWRRSRASAAAARAARVCTPRAIPSSHRESSWTGGVPSPPRPVSRSPPAGSGGIPFCQGSCAWRSAQCRIRSRSSTSAWRRRRHTASSHRAVPVASRSSTGSMGRSYSTHMFDCKPQSAPIPPMTRANSSDRYAAYTVER